MPHSGLKPKNRNDLWWKKTFDGRWPLTKDDLWRRTTFDKRRPMAEDNLWRKTTFDGERLLTEYNLWRKTPLVEVLPKTSCTLLEVTRCWTYSALRYFFQVIYYTSYWRLSSIEGRLPSKVVFSKMSSSVKGCLPPKVILPQRSSSIKSGLPSNYM